MFSVYTSNISALCPPHININDIFCDIFLSITQVCGAIYKILPLPVGCRGDCFCVKGDKGLMNSLGGSQRCRRASGWCYAATRIPYTVSMTLLLFLEAASSLQCSIRQNAYLPIYSACGMEVINMPLAKKV